MKTSQIEKVIAELQAEKAIVDFCIAEVRASTSTAEETLTHRSHTLASCIVRISGQNSGAAPKPVRTRKSHKAQEPTL